METGMTKFGAVSILYPTLVLFRTFPMGDIKTNLLKRFAEFPRFFSNFFPEFSDIIFNRDDGFFFFQSFFPQYRQNPLGKWDTYKGPSLCFPVTRVSLDLFLFLEESLFIWISYLHEDREVRSVSRPVRYHYRLLNW